MTASFIHPEPLVTPRVLVRAVAQSDLADLLVVNGNDEVTRYLPYPSWASMPDAWAWWERMEASRASGTALQWVLVDRASGTVMGACVLFHYDAGSARAELGYVLGRSWWGQGLMREALVALVGSAVDTLGLRRIEAEVDPRNLASGALLRSLGFQAEGVLRGRWVNKGVVCDVESFGLLSDEWNAEQAANPLLFNR